MVTLTPFPGTDVCVDACGGADPFGTVYTPSHARYDGCGGIFISSRRLPACMVGPTYSFRIPTRAMAAPAPSTLSGALFLDAATGGSVITSTDIVTHGRRDFDGAGPFRPAGCLSVAVLSVYGASLPAAIGVYVGGQHGRSRGFTAGFRRAKFGCIPVSLGTESNIGVLLAGRPASETDGPVSAAARNGLCEWRQRLR